MATIGPGPGRILLTVQHPGHVHFFKHVYRELQADGHSVAVIGRNETVVEDLLEEYGMEHRLVGETPDGLTALAATQARYEAALYRYARRFSPDIIAGIGGVAAAHVARLVGARGIVFTDTEHATLSNALAIPFADLVCTPDCFHKDLGSKQYRYPGYHELAYLTPERFTPDSSVLDAVGVGPQETFVILRLTAWNALHDVGEGGLAGAVDIVEQLEATGARVLITASVDLPSELESRRAAVPPHRLHDLLANAALFIGEGATTAAESAVLGTPAVYVNTLEAGTLAELENRYGLLFGFHGQDRHRRGLEQALEILSEGDDTRWERRRRRLLDDKCDTTAVVKRLLTEGQAPDIVEAAG